MRKIVAGALAAIGVGAASAVVIVADRGGNVGRYANYYADMARRGERVQINGECSSACTMALYYDNLCVGPRAVLGFHSAYTYTFLWFGWKHHNQPATDLMWAHYPKPIQKWITVHGGLKPDMIYLRGDELRKLVRAC